MIKEKNKKNVEAIQQTKNKENTKKDKEYQIMNFGKKKVNDEKTDIDKNEINKEIDSKLFYYNLYYIYNWNYQKCKNYKFGL